MNYRIELEEDIHRVLKITGGYLNSTLYKQFGKYSISCLKNHFGNFSEARKYFNAKQGSFQENFLKFFENYTGIILQREVSFATCINPKTGQKLRFDGYSEEYNLLVEVDDVSHFIPLEYMGGEDGLRERQYRDNIKDIWAKENNLYLFRISYKDDWSQHYIYDRLHTLKDLPKPNLHIVSSKYRGVSRYKDKWQARIKEKDGVKSLGVYEDELYAAIIREKYILFKNDLVLTKNNIGLAELGLYGFSSWEEVPLIYPKILQRKRYFAETHTKQKQQILVESKYYGVSFGRNEFRARATVNGKRRQIGAFSDEKKAALYREGFIIFNNLKDKRNNFTLNDLSLYGLQSWDQFEKLKEDRRFKGGR